FLLELHSDKTRKSDVIASLRERLQLSPPVAPQELQRKIEQCTASRDKLRRYVELIATLVGRSSRPLHQLMWQSTRLAAELDDALPAALAKAPMAQAQNIDQGTLEATRQTLDAFAAARDHLIGAHGSPQQHPWYAVGATNPFLREEIIAAARS